MQTSRNICSSREYLIPAVLYRSNCASIQRGGSVCTSGPAATWSAPVGESRGLDGDCRVQGGERKGFSLVLLQEGPCLVLLCFKSPVFSVVAQDKAWGTPGWEVKGPLVQLYPSDLGLALEVPLPTSLLLRSRAALGRGGLVAQAQHRAKRCQVLILAWPATPSLGDVLLSASVSPAEVGGITSPDGD